MGRKKNKIGEKYYRLLVIEQVESKREPSGRLVPRVKVRCDCGVEKETCYKQLKRGKIKSCGCYSEEYSDSVRTKVEIGQIFTNWTIIAERKGYYHNGEKADRTFLCKCVCGAEKEVNRQSLSSGQSKSCGCRGIPRKEKIEYKRVVPVDTEEEKWKQCKNFKNFYISTKGRVFSFASQKYITRSTLNTIKIKGKVKTIISEIYETFIGEYDRVYTVPYYLNGVESLENIRFRETRTERVIRLKAVYRGMKSRCYNVNNKSYPSYGGKGIKVESSFDNVNKFIDWAIEQEYEPNIGLEIDRIDSTKGYDIENCRFVSRLENGLNVCYINLTLEDVRWIRSEDFTYEKASGKFITSRLTIENIREYRTFVEAPTI